jgi:acetyl esterase/lipase
VIFSGQRRELSSHVPRRFRIMTTPFHLPARWIFALLFATSLTGCTKFEVLNATIPKCGYVRTRNIPYGDQPRLKLDVYRPPCAAPNGTPGAKVVIFLYGGDWTSGNKSDYFFVAQALASKGFVAVLPDYRLYPEVVFPKFVEDGAAAIRWTHDHAREFGGDPDHLYLLGHSAGAHIAALLNLDAHYLKAVGIDRSVLRATCALSGPFDFVPGDSDRGAFNMKKGDTPDPAIEPLHFANGDSPPMLLIQGLADNVVLPKNSIELNQAIKAAGGDVRYLTYRKLDHPGTVLAFAWSFRWLAPVLKDTTAFFNSH